MKVTCSKCKKTHKPGKWYMFYSGQLVDAYSYDTTRYYGRRKTVTTHSGASYNMIKEEKDLLCNSCVIKSNLGGEVILVGVGLFLLALGGWGLSVLFFSYLPMLISRFLAGVWLIYEMVRVLRTLRAANSNNEAIQEEYLKDLASSETGNKLAIRHNRKHFSRLYGEKTVLFTPKEYHKLNQNY